MPGIDSSDIYYPVSWIKTTTDLVFNLFSSPQKTKRSLPEEAECGSLDGIKCWLREGMSRSSEHTQRHDWFGCLQVRISMPLMLMVTPHWWTQPCSVDSTLSECWSMLELTSNEKDNSVTPLCMQRLKMVISMLFKLWWNMEPASTARTTMETFHWFLVRQIRLFLSECLPEWLTLILCISSCSWYSCWNHRLPTQSRFGYPSEWLARTIGRTYS